MNSPQLWGTGLGVLVGATSDGGVVVAGTTVLCVEQNSLGSSKQRGSWSGSTKEELGSNVCLADGANDARDCHWSRLIGLREAQAARPAGSDPGPGRLPGRASWLRLLQIQLNSRRSSGAREIAPIFLEFFIFGFPPSLPASCAVRHDAVGLRIARALRFEAFAG